MKMTAFSIVLALSVGCSTSGTAAFSGDGSTRAGTTAGSIALLEGPPSRPHEIVAIVEGVAATDDHLSKARTEAAALASIKAEASRIGANAVVLTSKDSSPSGQSTVGFGTPTHAGYGTDDSAAFASLGWEKITISGTAIRYTDGSD